METITARDAGRALVGCLDIGDDSDFWGSCYNISGGPGCRATYLEFLNRIYRMLGVDYRRAMKREWFALRNFHMQFYEDSGILNGYLHHWDEGEDLEDYYRDVWRALPWYLHLVAWLNKRVKPFRRLVEYAIRMQLRSVAMRKDGTLWWIRRGDESMIRAFYGSMEEFRSIPGWDVDMPDLDHRQGYRRLDHGYDESKEVPDQGELIAAAQFRGGSLISNDWNGDMFTSLRWECSRGHVFEMTPNSILRCGHWCMECITPPQDYREIARLNRFAAQVLSTWSAG
jgi:hypothetical protein